VLVKMPQLGESVTEGTIGRWLKSPGDRVEKYEPLVEVTTDKVNAEVPSPVSGTLTRIVGEEGQTLAVGDLVCEIAVEGQEANPSGAEGEAAPSAPLPQGAALPVGEPPVLQPEARTTMPAPAAAAATAVRTSPYVRRLARQAGIDLAAVPGTGPGGRVRAEDIAAFREAPPKAQAAPAAGAPAPSVPPRAPAAVAAAPAPIEAASRPAPRTQPMVASDEDQVLELTPMRRSIAEHMVRTKHTSPHATAWFEVDVSGLVALRERVKTAFTEREGVPLTYLPFVIQAVVEGIRSFPILNSSFDNEANRIVLRRHVNIGVAVAVEDGLIVPVIRDADGLSLTGLARRLDDVITRARRGTLTLDDIQGGTFTVNNPGSYGSILSTPLINQPQAAILSMEKIVKRAVVISDAIAVRSMMNLSMSFDHRVLDGAVANLFLSRVKEYLEGLGPDSPVA